MVADGDGSFQCYAERDIWGKLKERKDTGEDAWGDSLRLAAYPYDPVDYMDSEGEFGHIAAAAFGRAVIGAVTMFAGDVVAGTVGNMLNRAISGER